MSACIVRTLEQLARTHERGCGGGCKTIPKGQARCGRWSPSRMGPALRLPVRSIRCGRAGRGMRCGGDASARGAWWRAARVCVKHCVLAAQPPNSAGRVGVRKWRPLVWPLCFNFLLVFSRLRAVMPLLTYYSSVLALLVPGARPQHAEGHFSNPGRPDGCCHGRGHGCL